MTSTSLPTPRSLSWRVPAIDGLRALATLMVFTFHTWEFAGKPELNLAAGAWQFNLLSLVQSFPAGVDLFMVLSGFCLFLPLCKENGLEKWQLGSYFVRRIRRIAPPYYAAILYAILLPQILVLLFRAIGAEASWQPVPSLFQIWTHLLFIHTLFVETWSGINGSFWSLGLEAQFYLAFPVAVWGFARFGTRFFWIMIAASLLYRVGVTWFFNTTGQPLSGDREFVFSIFFLGRWMQFALGMAAAWFVATRWKTERMLSSVQGTILLIVAVGAYFVSINDVVAQIKIFPLRDLFLGLSFAAAIIGLCASHSSWRAPFENRFITGLGFISYSVFLIHQPTAWYTSELLRKVLGLDKLPLLIALWTLGLGITIAIAYVFFLAVERPFLNTKKVEDSRNSKQIAAEAGSQPTGAVTAKEEGLLVQDQSVP